VSEPVRVLLADHEEPFRQMAGDALRSAGFQCDSFRDGERAAAALQAGAYDLLVVSTAMPGNRDFELLRRAGGEPVGMPVIVLAKPASLSTAVTALRLGAVDYLVKPLEIADLVKAVKKAGEKALALRTVRSVQRVIGVCTGWFRELETVLAMPGPLSLPPPVRSALVETPGQVQPLRDALLWGNLEPKEVAALSPREREVLRALVAGRRVREIARALGIAVNTGRKHVKAILRKLGVHSQAELVERFRNP
jgi:DNA-binding NarL/FixJ family response regulator